METDIEKKEKRNIQNIEALKKHTNCEYSDIKKEGKTTYYIGDQAYLVLSDKEAQTRCEEDIKQFVWAFNSSFLSFHTDINEDIIKSVQEHSEGSNDMLLNSIKDIQKFINEAIASDGRGHFISYYDGHEHEENDLFIYRLN
tara:strand:+ start:351 stop:776 length:426 start_codon:yes stop_codon:yes gene_type:complete